MSNFLYYRSPKPLHHGELFKKPAETTISRERGPSQKDSARDNKRKHNAEKGHDAQGHPLGIKSRYNTIGFN
jgi:hypothetical protein